MIWGARGGLRVALLLHSHRSPAASAQDRALLELASGLRDRGHWPQILALGPTCDRLEALLQFRGFASRLTHVPFSARALTAGRFHIAHAFSVPDAASALLWRRLTGRPVAFTCLDLLRREQLADRRLRMALLQRAVEGSDAVLSVSDDVRDSLRRWLATDARVLRLDETAEHESLYLRLLEGRDRSGPSRG